MGRQRIRAIPISLMNAGVIGLSTHCFNCDWYKAAVATSPHPLQAWSWYESAKVSGQVASQTCNWPCDKGITVAPSGLLLSVLDKPFGSSCTGILAASRSLPSMMSPFTFVVAQGMNVLAA